METATKPLFQQEAEEIAWYMTHLSVDELKRSLKLTHIAQPLEPDC